MKFNANDIKEFIIKHYQYFGVGFLFICLVVVLLIFSQGRKKTEQAGSAEASVSNQTAEGALAVPETELEVDAYAGVNDLISRYFAATAAGDTNALSTICSELDEKEKIRIEKKAEYTENYENFVCYTKPGPEANSYIVFAYYEVKFKNINTLAPGLISLYVRTAEDGSLYVYDGELDNSVSDYIKAIAAQDDVVDLLNKVDTKYTEASENDPELKNFMDALPNALDNAVSAELAARESQSETSEGADVSQNGAQSAVKVKAKETVNVRKSPSEEGDKIGQLTGGDTFTCLENLDNGWSKIDYQGGEAYVKSEYIEPVSEEAEAPVAETAPEQTETPAATDTNNGNKTGTVTAKETVKIRKGASTDSEQLGSAYQGEKFDLIMEMEDGWCKITYKGQTAYVKSDYVDIKRN